MTTKVDIRDIPVYLTTISHENIKELHLIQDEVPEILLRIIEVLYPIFKDKFYITTLSMEKEDDAYRIVLKSFYFKLTVSCIKYPGSSAFIYFNNYRDIVNQCLTSVNFDNIDTMTERLNIILKDYHCKYYPIF